MSRFFEINGNLNDNSYGLANYNDFCHEIENVYNFFSNELGADVLNKIPVYVDNGTQNTGYVPVNTPVLGQFVLIKLGIQSNFSSDIIVFQFAHELMHVVFRSVLGWEKPFANEDEEAICAAASLVAIKEFYPDKLSIFSNELASQKREGYQRGVLVAEVNNYNLKSLYDKIKHVKY